MLNTFQKIQNIKFTAIPRFPVPPKKTQYKVYHLNSTIVKTEFGLSYYCRIVNAASIRTVDLPIIFDLLQQNLPEGVELTIQQVCRIRYF